MRAHLLSHRLLSRRGGVTPLALVSLGLLLGVVALAVDGGTLMEERRHVQATADAAALAAAADLFANYSANSGADLAGTAKASALAIAAANGFSNDGVQSIVTVNTSSGTYQGGPNAGKALLAGYVEVVVQYNAGRTFSNVFGSGALPIRARAVARGIAAANNYGLTLLNLSQSGALTINGSGSLKVNGTVFVNSKSSSAISLNGGGGVIALAYDLVGAIGGLLGWLLGLLGLGGSPATPTTVQPIADPLRYLPEPDPVKLGLSARAGINISGTTPVDLYPGVYTSDIKVVLQGKAILHANPDGTPGIYYFQGGGLVIRGNGSVATAAGEAGVMIFNNWQAGGSGINMGGNGSLSLTPPASGAYTGISIFQQRGTLTNPAPTLTLIGDVNVAGTIYAVYANVSLSSASILSVLGGQIIADTLTVSGSTTVNLDPGISPVARTRTIGLVE